MPASWSSPRRRPYVDVSPISPISPQSPLPLSGLPPWIRPTRRFGGRGCYGQLRVVLIAIGCIMLGWMMTLALGPPEDPPLEQVQQGNDMAAGGLLTDPSGFGTPLSHKSKPGILSVGHEADYGDPDMASSGHRTKASVSDALSELHHALGEKLLSWSPYRGQTSERIPSSASKNVTQFAGANLSPSIDGEDIKNGIKDEDRLGARTHIGKITMLYNPNSIYERSFRTHEEHDRLHGYRLHILRESMIDDIWNKQAYILSVLLRELAKPESERLEWLFWMDADTIILNPLIPLETFLPPPGPDFDHVNLIYASDWNGVNAGVFALRVTQWAVRLMSNIISFRYYRPDINLPFSEQSAMAVLMTEPYFVKNVVQAPQRWFNAYQGEHNETLMPHQIRRGDLLVHFAGVGDRHERMVYWLNRAEQRLDDWEIPLKSTTYPQETRDFWAGERAARNDRARALEASRQKADKLVQATEEQIKIYGDRLTDEERGRIVEQCEELRNKLQDSTRYDAAAVFEDGHKALTEVSAPLTAAISVATQNLLRSAHEAIFAAEKILLGASPSENDDTDLMHLADTLNRLKDLIMMPQEEWHRDDIVEAMNSMTEARATWLAKKKEEAAAKQALVEAKKAALIEAGLNAATTAKASPPGSRESQIAGAHATGAKHMSSNNGVATKLSGNEPGNGVEDSHGSDGDTADSVPAQSMDSGHPDTPQEKPKTDPSPDQPMSQDGTSMSGELTSSDDENTGSAASPDDPSPDDPSPETLAISSESS